MFIAAHAPPQSLLMEEEAEACLQSLREALTSVEDMLSHTTAPNMKALEKIKEVKDKFHDVAKGNFCFLEL